MGAKKMNKKFKPYQTEYITVNTWNFKVGKRTFSFNYRLERNGFLVREDVYRNSHTRAPSTMRKYLLNGYATSLVLEAGVDFD